MPGQGQSGRSMIVTRGGTRVAGAQTKSIAIGAESIDVTADEDAAWRKLLDMPAEVVATISVAGVLVNEQLQAEAVSTSDRMQATQFILSGYDGSPADTHGYSGDFFLSQFTITGEYKGKATFEATFESSGPVTYTAA